MIRKKISLDQETMDIINKEVEQIHLSKSSFLRYLLINYYTKKKDWLFTFDYPTCKEVENEKK